VIHDFPVNLTPVSEPTRPQIWSRDVGYNRRNDLNWVLLGQHAVSALGPYGGKVVRRFAIYDSSGTMLDRSIIRQLSFSFPQRSGTSRTALAGEPSSSRVT
jgi:hypothetical protein